MKKQPFWKRLILKQPAKNITDDDLQTAQAKVSEKGEDTNPYTSAKRVYNDRSGSLISSRNTWQVIGLFSLVIAIASVSGMSYLGAQTKFVPYVVQVDKLGDVQRAGIVQRTDVDPRIIKYTISQFITDARMVTVDAQLQKKAILDVYSHLAAKDPSYMKMDRWFNSSADSTPFARAKKELVSTRITSVLQLTNDTWQIDWEETSTDHHGKLLHDPVKMRALVTVYVSNAPVANANNISQDNPLNIYIKDLSWSQIM